MIFDNVQRCVLVNKSLASAISVTYLAPLSKVLTATNFLLDHIIFIAVVTGRITIGRRFSFTTGSGEWRGAIIFQWLEVSVLFGD